MMSKAEATIRGRQLVKELGKGWKLRVHENFGWYYSAFKGPCRVNPSYNGEPVFYCMISSNWTPGEYPLGGFTGWQDPKHLRFKDPRRAVRRAVKLVREYVQRHSLVSDASEATLDFKETK